MFSYGDANTLVARSAADFYAAVRDAPTSTIVPVERESPSGPRWFLYRYGDNDVYLRRVHQTCAARHVQQQQQQGENERVYRYPTAEIRDSREPTADRRRRSDIFVSAEPDPT